MDRTADYVKRIRSFFSGSTDLPVVSSRISVNTQQAATTHNDGTPLAHENDLPRLPDLYLNVGLNNSIQYADCMLARRCQTNKAVTPRRGSSLLSHQSTSPATPLSFQALGDSSFYSQVNDP